MFVPLPLRFRLPRAEHADHALVGLSFGERFARRDSWRPSGLWRLLSEGPILKKHVIGYAFGGLVSIPARFLSASTILFRTRQGFFLLSRLSIVSELNQLLICSCANRRLRSAASTAADKIRRLMKSQYVRLRSQWGFSTPYFSSLWPNKKRRDLHQACESVGAASACLLTQLRCYRLDVAIPSHLAGA
jgi:hypothetical protein